MFSERGTVLVLTSLYQVYFQKFATFEMDSMAHVQYSTAIPGAALLFVGDLEFHQSEPLAHKGVDRRFNVSIICLTAQRAWIVPYRNTQPQIYTLLQRIILL